MSEENKLSRREFIKDAAIGAAAVAGAGVLGAAPAYAAPNIPDKWDREADVVIIGYGGAGAVAAITATDLGAKVLVLEKAPIEGGGSSRMSTAGVLYAADTVEMAKYLEAMSWGNTPKEYCQAWAEGAAKRRDFLKKMGVPIVEGTPGSVEYPNLPGIKGVSRTSITGNGPVYWPIIDAQVKKRNIEVLFDSPAKDLIQNQDTKEIVGVIATSKGKDISIKAKKAVILCCGGFAFNEEMKGNYLRSSAYHFYSWRYNTGDGIRMGTKVGAALWHMNSNPGRLSPWFPEYESAFTMRAPKTNNFIFVDKHGRRYGNETAGWMGHGWHYKMLDLDLSVPEWTRVPSYIIFDETARLAGQVVQTSVGICTIPKELGGATWSADNSEEIKKGWIKKADTIEALAALITGAEDPAPIKAKMDVANLKATVERFNKFCADKNDADFGRAAALMAPIEKPPFYAMILFPTGCNTNGGPKRNGKGQVVDYENKPIPRLYEAGELGIGWGFLYQGSGAFGDTVIFGQISGQNAAAEKPWDAKA